MAVTDRCRRTIMFLAFLCLSREAGLHVQGDDTGMHHPTNAASTREISQKLRAGQHASGTKFALRSSMRIPSRVLDEVVLQNNKTWIPGSNASDPAQVSLSSSSDKSWCIAKSSMGPDAVQAALDWACGPYGGADCDPIQLGNACFIPNTVYFHASYAFNSYYQIHQHASDTCNFGGTATVTYEDPSYVGCSYPSRSGQPGAPVIGEASRSPTSAIGALIALSILLSMSRDEYDILLDVSQECCYQSTLFAAIALKCRFRERTCGMTCSFEGFVYGGIMYIYTRKKSLNVQIALESMSWLFLSEKPGFMTTLACEMRSRGIDVSLELGRYIITQPCIFVFRRIEVLAVRRLFLLSRFSLMLPSILSYTLPLFLLQ